MSKLSEVAVTVLPKETSSESVPPVTFKAMSELNETDQHNSGHPLYLHFLQA